MSESLSTSLLGSWLLRIGEVSKKLAEADAELVGALLGNRLLCFLCLRSVFQFAPNEMLTVSIPHRRIHS